MGFTYSKKVELLTYALSINKHMTALDKSISKEINRLYNKDEFPLRKTNLFYLGIRQ